MALPRTFRRVLDPNGNETAIKGPEGRGLTEKANFRQVLLTVYRGRRVPTLPGFRASLP